jgi:tetratricopeptide (TPR) repeat protein
MVFGQTLQDRFLNYDDNDYVYDNPKITNGLTADGTKWAFTHFHADNWHPLTTISHMVDCQLYGLQPWGHHLTNLLLHATAAIFLFLALRKLTIATWPSAFVAALFAVHPLRVESVAWISERKDVLSGVFFMLTLWAYANYARSDSRSVGKYVTVLVLFALGLMCKPSVVTLPFVLLLLDYWPLGRMQGAKSKEQGIDLQAVRGLVVEKIPLFVLSAASSVVTVLAQREAFTATFQLPFQARFANAVLSYVAYLGQVIWPMNLAVLYPYPEGNLNFVEVIVALLFLWIVSIIFFFWRKRYPFLLVGWLWFLGMLVPMIGLVQVGSQPRADRYTYLPEIGLCILVTWGGLELFKKWHQSRTISAAAVALILVALGTRSYFQSSYWRNSETLWQHAVDVTSNNHIAENSLGNALLEKDRLNEAIEHYKRAIAIKPDVAPVQSNLGNALLRKNQIDEAIPHIQKAIQVNPQYAEAYNDMGSALIKRGQAAQAISYYQKAVELNTRYADAYNNLAVAFLENGQVDEAIEHYKKAVAIKPESADMQCNLGNALAKKGNWTEAIAAYQASLRGRPDYVKAHNNLGVALETIGRNDDAFEQFAEALRSNENYPEAHYNLGRLLARLGRRDEAIAHFSEAVRLKPDYSEAQSELGVLQSKR